MTGASKPKILCVDDEVDIVETLSRVLRTDFQVLTANSVADAMRVLEDHPDLAIILSDQRMPDGTGLSLLVHAQEKYPEAVRALLTGHAEIDDLVVAINRAQVHRLILKPWDGDYLRIQMLESLTTHAALKERTELTKLATTDPVTGLYNHRYFQDRLKIEVERAKRHQRELSLLMVDIDHFKTLNDTRGHVVGDAILRQVANRLLAGVRNLDIVARYGGDEFAILLPDTSIASAEHVANRLRESLRTTAPTYPDLGPIAVSLSLGVACVPAHANSAVDLLRKADAALYRAKRQGRNQSVVASMDRPLD